MAKPSQPRKGPGIKALGQVSDSPSTEAGVRDIQSPSRRRRTGRNSLGSAKEKTDLPQGKEVFLPMYGTAVTTELRASCLPVPPGRTYARGAYAPVRGGRKGPWDRGVQPYRVCSLLGQYGGIPIRRLGTSLGKALGLLQAKLRQGTGRPRPATPIVPSRKRRGGTHGDRKIWRESPG